MQTVQTFAFEQSSTSHPLDPPSFVLSLVGCFLLFLIIMLLIAIVKDIFKHFSDLYFPRQCFTDAEKRDNLIYRMGFDRGKMAKPGEECPTYHQLPKDKKT